MNHSDGPHSGSGRVSIPPELKGPGSLPPALIPSKVNADKRVLDQAAEVAPKSVRGALPLSPHARNIDSLERDIRMLLSGYRESADPMVIDATAHAAAETRMILHFLFDAKSHMRDIKLAPFAQSKITAVNNAVKSVSVPYEEAFLQHVQVARYMEDGLGQRGYNWAFQRHESGTGVVYTEEMLKVMREIVRMRGFNLKDDVDGIVKSINDDYASRGLRPSREQFIADFRQVVEVMGHYETYGDSERPSITSIQSQKMKIQQFLQQLGVSHGIDSDVPKWQDIIGTNVEKFEDPAQYFHYESLLHVASKAANQPLKPESVRYAVSAINRYLMQAYYAAFELKLIGKNV